jgi:hypothetical protein
MVIFHSYISLPEGTPGSHPKKNWAGSLTMKLEPITTGRCFADRYIWCTEVQLASAGCRSEIRVPTKMLKVNQDHPCLLDLIGVLLICQPISSHPELNHSTPHQVHQAARDSYTGTCAPWPQNTKNS